MGQCSDCQVTPASLWRMFRLEFLGHWHHLLFERERMFYQASAFGRVRRGVEDGERGPLRAESEGDPYALIGLRMGHFPLQIEYFDPPLLIYGADEMHLAGGHWQAFG